MGVYKQLRVQTASKFTGEFTERLLCTQVTQGLQNSATAVVAPRDGA